jgi:hypothetical protein
MVYTPYRILLNDQMKEYEVGRACRAYVGEGKCIQDFGGETLKKLVGRTARRA